MPCMILLSDIHLVFCLHFTIHLCRLPLLCARFDLFLPRLSTFFLPFRPTWLPQGLSVSGLLHTRPRRTTQSTPERPTFTRPQRKSPLHECMRKMNPDTLESREHFSTDQTRSRSSMLFCPTNSSKPAQTFTTPINASPNSTLRNGSKEPLSCVLEP